MGDTAERPTDRPEAFERIEYAALRIPLTRREAMSAPLEWLRARSGDAEGRPALPLAPLGTMPDEELADLTPAIAPGCEILVREGAVWARRPGLAVPVRILAMTPSGLCAFNAMNGATTVGEIAGAVAAETGWPHDRAFAFARGLFLYLVSLRVCVPAECE